ncbi:hypothetical protein K523DRAFT_359294 [Schizophyllum commune Tattone D]|nr:hypothetical protein K523DRAFT_359294 [Schizophyllum commune Tattone D]
MNGEEAMQNRIEEEMMSAAASALDIKADEKDGLNVQERELLEGRAELTSDSQVPSKLMST